MKTHSDLVIMLIGSTVVFLVSLVIFYARKAPGDGWQVITPIFMYVFNLMSLWSLNLKLGKDRAITEADKAIVEGFKRSEVSSVNNRLSDETLGKVALAVLTSLGVTMDGMYKNLLPDLADVVYYHWEKKMHMNAVASKLNISDKEAYDCLEQAFDILRKGIVETARRSRY